MPCRSGGRRVDRGDVRQRSDARLFPLPGRGVVAGSAASVLSACLRQGYGGTAHRGRSVRGEGISASGRSRRFAAAAEGKAAMIGRRPTIREGAVAAAVFALATLHLLLLFAPDAVLRWNRHASRLLLLEATGFAAGVICSMAVISKMRRHLFDRAGDDDRALTDTVSLTLVLIAVVSGVALASSYRWASSWSVVTLTPYAVSLARLAPRVELIAATPFVVRLHVFCSFPLVALLVFTRLGSAAHAALDRIFDRVGAALGRLRAEEIWREEEN
ncbi:MAG: hypothetical protein DMG02_20345 [Acidobacteria bacterium]|nr:MAG: hypothetical protein DMG02_20345 [Acidobacteriota bacterium]PYR10049.1 MAG: hypothetical protein DMF99_13320 [Acidobacteriota bacterium]